MKDEYIIINKTAIQQRIEELDKLIQNLIKGIKDEFDRLGDTKEFYEFKQNISSTQTQFILERKLLKQILSQSTPLIPVIDRAYDAGKLDKDLSLMFDNPKARYISNLKLEI